MRKAGRYHVWERREIHTEFWAEKREDRPPGSPKGRRDDNVKINLTDTGWEDVDRIDLAQDRML